MIKTSRLSPLSMCNTATQLAYEVKIIPGSNGQTAQTLDARGVMLIMTSDSL